MCVLLPNVLLYFGEKSYITIKSDASRKLKKEVLFFCMLFCYTLPRIQSDGGGVYLQELQILLNSVQHHKVLYKSHCVTNTLNSAAALTTVKATEGGLLKVKSEYILKLSSQLIVSTVSTTL